MSTISPSRLLNVETASTHKALVQDNMEILAEEVAKRVATYQSGTPTTIIGPPTSGDRVLNEFWRDAIGGEWRCTSAGAPGTWIQIRPAAVTSDPAAGTIPTGYVIWNVTTNQLKIHLGSYSWAVRFGDGTNFTQFASDGTMTMAGTATVFDDLRIPVTSTKPGVSNPPDFAKVLDDGSGSQGVFTYLFDDTTEEDIYFTVQLPHAWKANSDITPHVHWMPTDASAGDVVWGLEYSWANINATFGNTTLATVTDSTNSSADDHLMAVFSDISGSGKTASSMLICRLYRKAADAADTYAADAALIEVDFHYQIDKLGDASLP